MCGHTQKKSSSFQIKNSILIDTGEAHFFLFKCNPKPCILLQNSEKDSVPPMEQQLKGLDPPDATSIPNQKGGRNLPPENQYALRIVNVLSGPMIAFISCLFSYSRITASSFAMIRSPSLGSVPHT